MGGSQSWKHKVSIDNEWKRYSIISVTRVSKNKMEATKRGRFSQWKQTNTDFNGMKICQIKIVNSFFCICTLSISSRSVYTCPGSPREASSYLQLSLTSSFVYCVSVNDSWLNIVFCSSKTSDRQIRYLTLTRTVQYLTIKNIQLINQTKCGNITGLKNTSM